jgi:NADPH-dependent ferric siderophore reductase
VNRVRREPPPFRAVTVARTRPLSPGMMRVTLTGPALEGLVIDQPAASVRLLLPAPGSVELVMPTWRGNEFLLPDGRRPVIRTLTPRRLDPSRLELDVDVVLHEGGVASGWAAGAADGSPAAVSGPARGYVIDTAASGFVLAGDETALPAIGQLLESLPVTAPVTAFVELARPEARIDLPAHPLATVNWCDLPEGATPGDAFVAAVTGADLTPGVRVWAAGEAAAVQRVRLHLFGERGLPRSDATIRGYWKHGRAGGVDDDA